MKKTIMKVILAFCFLCLATQLFAFGVKEPSNWATVENFHSEVQKKLGHELEKYELNIIDTTYLYYYGKCEQNWTLEMWNTAVEKSVELCKNPAAVTASKAGVFGEKLLQTLVVTTEDIVSGLNNWLESGSEEYKKRHK